MKFINWLVEPMLYDGRIYSVRMKFTRVFKSQHDPFRAVPLAESLSLESINSKLNQISGVFRMVFLHNCVFSV